MAYGQGYCLTCGRLLPVQRRGRPRQFDTVACRRWAAALAELEDTASEVGQHAREGEPTEFPTARLFAVMRQVGRKPKRAG